MAWDLGRERWCGVKGMEILESEGLDIDDEAGASKARILATPASVHLTCLKHGNMLGETTIPACNEGSCCTQVTLDSSR